MTWRIGKGNLLHRPPSHLLQLQLQLQPQLQFHLYFAQLKLKCTRTAQQMREAAFGC